MKRAVGIKDLSHRITLCSARDETINSVEILLKRVGIFEAWAAIAPVRGQFFAGGFSVKEGREHYSHNIWIRFRPDMDITAWAWIFEPRPSGARWYKVLAVEERDEAGRWWVMQCRLSQKGDDVVMPAKQDNAHPAKSPFDCAPLPDGVRL